MTQTTIYALDFDGVICDSAVETAMTGWKAAGRIWNDMPSDTPEILVDRFRAVRPIIETGYEAILAMRLLHLGESCEAIFENYADMTTRLMQETQIDIAELKRLFGDVRDQWIADDLASWIAMNPLFPGVAKKLRRLSETRTWYVVTTKQERFVEHIFNANAIALADECIFGMDRNLSKQAVLEDLIHQHPGQTLMFVEDRLPTLIKTKTHPPLAEVELLFALWGYNTADDKSLAKQQGFTTLNLDEFLAE